jgi:hypothetical protein
MFSSAFSLKKQQGSALLFTFFVVILLVSLVGALLFPTLVRSSATQFDIHRFHALNIAEAGLSNVLYNVQNGGTGALGTKGAPLPYHHGSYYTLITLGKPSPLLNEIIVMSRFQQASCKITAITDYPIPQKAEEKPPAEGILFSPPVPLLSKGKIIIGGNTGVTKGQSVKGSIHSNDSITIQGNIKIEGDIHSSKKIEISGRPQILGEVQEDVETP